MTESNMTSDIDRLFLQWEEHKSAILCTRLADMLRRAKRLEEAVDLALEGLGNWDRNTSITIVLARTYRDAGDLEKAYEYFRAVCDRQPRNLVVLKNLGEISYTRGHLDRATQYFSDYLAEHPGDDEIREKLDNIRSTGIRMPLKEPKDETSETISNEDGVTDIEEDLPTEFPQTQRMAKVLREQGITVEKEDEKEKEDESHKQEETESVIVEVAKEKENPDLSLLDFFTDEEREKYGLKPYDGDNR